MASQSRNLSQGTIAVRGGLNTDDQYGSVVPVITPSTCYRYQEFATPRQFDYARKSNPSRRLVEQTVAKLEGGADAILTNCGMSAIHLVSVALLTPNDLVVAPHDCYGGSYRLFNSLSERGYFKTKFVDQSDPIALKQALSLGPKLVLIESPSNPLLRVVDIQDITRQAHQAGAIVLVDNTFMTPILQKPLELGADIVTHSCTKFLNGHSDLLAGILVFKDQQLATDVLWWANNIGTLTSSFDSYLLLRGLRTLAARVKLQQDNAQKVVEFLVNHPKVAKVYHPSLPSNLGHEIAKKQQKGFGSLLSFELAGQAEVMPKFLKALNIFTLAQSLGGVESLICHPATMTHSGISAEARKTAGISDQLLRISVGLEEVDDLLADLQQALSVI
ncbi:MULTISPECIES: cystathionine gamma-synthase [unclassified Gilliamella]|uniref:cystathionine gamma-synthase n=1 Tax=unclassified Gilliamella TaxID=2685620 RepID=UPI00226AEC05|nr:MULTISPECIES: cystathionine gamma-synthase [unclassified Gilliamella]MCX8641421.1 cystathionine gamma-synthase [Gilliamella sp. B3835]MCX8707531.1 cystathionine gamma-synthase [Gilliamella sp. B3783]MCX8710611.1 cystathionine gamma-synthase [Gilliamella sp. B3780]MCX8714726.1 cystathionine gamma-synthase [Gilliamella sp. B3781]MCX8716462.1 cystathionine gamma-synthase [Gilliamella sp. B3784]